MFEMPLFPLNTVLFPGMPLTLHIFEERYKRLIGRCLEERHPFGVVLIREGSEALGPLAEPYYIGCSARILEVERLEEGRMNIVALGQQRFRILSLNHEKPYLTGLVEHFPLDESNKTALKRSGRRLFPWVKRYMEILTRISEVDLDIQHVPEDPLVLAYLAAVLLQVPPAQKQELLASERAQDLLEHMFVIYRREVALLDAILVGGDGKEDGNFSIN